MRWNNNMKAINKKSISYMLLMIPFFYNIFNDTIPLVYTINSIWKIISSIIIISLFFYDKINSKLIRIDKIFIYSMLSMITLFLSTLINSGNLIKYFGYFISCIVILMAFNVFSKKTNSFAFSQSIYIIIKFYLICEIISLFMFPKGMYSTSGNGRLSFLGLDNNATAFLIMSITYILSYAYSLSNKISLSYYIDVILIISCIIYIFSVTGVIGLIIFFIFLKVKNISSKTKILMAMLINLAIFITFTLFNNFNILKLLTENLFNKDIMLSGRVPIWNAYINNIKNNFFIGHGITKNNQALVYVKEMWDHRLAHNEVLQHLADGGIFYLTFFICSILICSLKIKNNTYKSTVVLTAGICAFIVMFVSETYTQNTSFFILLFANYYGLFNNCLNKNLCVKE